MSILDIALIIFFILGMVSGYRRGFLVSLFSLLAIFLGILVGFKLMGAAMLTLDDHYNIDEKILPYVAFAVVFIIIVIVVNLLGKVLRSSIDKTILGAADQWAGSILGLLRAAFMLSVIFWILNSLSVELPAHWSENSRLYEFTAQFAPKVTQWFGEIFPAFQDLFGSKT